MKFDYYYNTIIIRGYYIFVKLGNVNEIKFKIRLKF